VLLKLKLPAEGVAKKLQALKLKLPRKKQKIVQQRLENKPKHIED